MLGGKQKFHGQSGFFEAKMNAAVIKKANRDAGAASGCTAVFDGPEREV